MFSKQASSRLRRAKSEVTHGRSTVANLKSGFRDRFFNRLRISRSRSVDRFRQIVEDYGDNIHYKSIGDLRKALLKDQEAASLMKTDEVNDLLNEIEQELALVVLQTEAEEYLEEHQVETNDIVNRHLVCVICNNVSEKNNVCSGCSTVMNSAFLD